MRKLFMAVSLAIVLMLGAAVPTSAQGESAIHGNVKARADGSSLPGAVVELQGAALPSAMTTTTTAEGQFAFPRLVPGEYMLTVTLASFQDERYRLSLKPREVQTLELALALRPVQESVQVVAAGIPSVFSPGSTHLTAERLAALPLTQRTNLPDAIVAAAPGMIRGHDDFVHIRGHEVALNPSINGVQFWENAHAVFSPGLGVDYIESMNVMTGGYAAEYGNRFGGILDVVTKSGFTAKNRGSVTFGTGSAQRHNVGLEFGGHTGRTGYYVNLSGFMSDRFLSPPSPRSIHNTGRGVRSFGQLDFRASDSDYFKVVMIGGRRELRASEGRARRVAAAEFQQPPTHPVTKPDPVVGPHSFREHPDADRVLSEVVQRASVSRHHRPVWRPNRCGTDAGYLRNQGRHHTFSRSAHREGRNGSGAVTSTRGSVLPEPAVDHVYALAGCQRAPRPLPWPEPRARRATAGRVQRQRDWWAGERLSAGQDPVDAELHR